MSSSTQFLSTCFTNVLSVQISSWMIIVLFSQELSSLFYSILSFFGCLLDSISSFSFSNVFINSYSYQTTSSLLPASSLVICLTLYHFCVTQQSFCYLSTKWVKDRIVILMLKCVKNLPPMLNPPRILLHKVLQLPQHLIFLLLL